MAEISFYINDNERKSLYNYLVEGGAKIIPDMLYTTDTFEVVESPNEFIETIENKTVGFFVCNDLFSKQKLILSQNRFIKTPAFSIDQRYGGPYINLSLYRGFAEDAKVKYKRTDIHHYPQYINIENNYEEFKASDELKDYYKSVIKFLKSISKNITVDGKKFWIGKEALREMEQKS